MKYKDIMLIPQGNIFYGIRMNWRIGPEGLEKTNG